MPLGYFENVGSFVRDCVNKTLRFDQACLRVITTENVEFWSQTTDCEGCALLKTAEFDSPSNLVVQTISPLRYAVRNDSGTICNGTYLFVEFGQYDLNLTDLTKHECTPKMTAEPDAALLPILTAVVILLSMATLWYVVKGIGKRIIAGRMYARYFAREDNELGSETRILTSESNVPRSPTRSRLRSLDIFRGIAIALMIFVNAGGGGYSIFSHSTWNGLTVADVIFPWFAFAMGEALLLTMSSRLATSISRLEALGQVTCRSLCLALIGICIGSVNSDWSNVRLPGVLQRLAAMYFIAGALECAFMRTSNDITPGRSLFRDISAGWQQWLATILIAGVQICITLTVSAPGCPRGYMGPGGLHLSQDGDRSLENCTGGIAGHIDRTVFGPLHLYQHGVFKSVYHTMVPHDPEGLLGVFSGLLVVQAGLHAARIMRAYNHARARIIRWVFWSLLLGAIGGSLCQFSKDGGVIPINKNLWSVSYCLVTASMAFFIRAVLYFIVDLKNKWGGRPLYYAGQNALFLYIGSELLKKNFPLHWAIKAPTHAQLLVTHAGTMLIWLAVGVYLHKKRIFITI